MDNQEGLLQKKTRIELTGGKTYDFPVNASADMFAFREERSQSEVRREDNATKARLQELETDKGVQYADRRKLETDNLKNQSARLIYDKKWYRFFQSESPEMVRVKKMLSYLNNVLDTTVEKYYKKDGQDGAFDGRAMKDDLDVAFDEAILACNDYITAKREKNGARRSTGARRLRKVTEIRNLCEQERLKYGFLVDALTGNSLKIRNVKEIMGKTPRQLTAEHKTLTTVKSIWQNKGNSTDVYWIKATENGKEVSYYIKENLPLISADPDGFLDRRIAQLEKSLESKKQGNVKKEEERMRDAGMQEEDYLACLTFLRAMKSKIRNASDTEKPAVRKRIIELFSHDFDRMFMNLTINNEAAKILDKEGGNAFNRQKWETIAADKDHMLNEVAQYILSVVKTQGEAAAKDAIKSMNAYEWIEKKLGLNQKEDKEVIRVLKTIYGEKNDRKLEHLFRTSLGKEVELFGQMRDRMHGDEREIAAANNTGTFLLAEIGGFTDVVTESDTRIVKFENREGETVERFCTVTREAEGEEFLELLKRAGKENKKIDYSPKAIQQLMRLQAFDTLCLQVDRHGSNFKCKVDPQAEEEGRIVITEIMSYDHDMSFGEESLENAFKDPVTGQEEKKGFLPSPTTRIKKNSPMYHYVMNNYFHFTVMNKAKEPDWEMWEKKLHLKKGEVKRLLVLPFYNDRFSLNEDSSIPLEQIYQGEKYFGKVMKIGKNGKRIALADEEEQEAAVSRFMKIFQKLYNLLSKKDRRGKKGLDALKTDFTMEEKKTVYRVLGELKQYMKEYDLSEIKLTNSITSGILQCWMEQIVYSFHNVFQADEEFTAYLMEHPEELLAEDRKRSKEEEKKRREDLKKLTDPNTGDLVIPSLLHYDLKAYQDICDLTDPLKEKEMELKLLPLFRKSKIDAIKKRAHEMKAAIEKAREKAEAFYRLAGWKGKKAQFFLEVNEQKGINDYARLENLTELSVDPGNTYLSIDNEKFLFGVSDFSEQTSSSEKKQALAEEKKKHQDPKRWKDQTYGSSADEETNMKEFLNNPLRGNITKPEKAS